jgi:hypothetical protein
MYLNDKSHRATKNLLSRDYQILRNISYFCAMNKSKTFIIYFLLTVTLLYASDSKAQYTLSPSATLVRYQIRNSLSYDSIHIANNSSDTLKLKWALIQYDTLGGSYFDFCSSGNCWLGFPASGSFPPIQPGGFGWAGLHYWSGNIPVSCAARIWLYKEGFFNTGDTLTYILHTISGNGIENIVEKEDPFTVYPNPATDRLYIRSACDMHEEISVSICNIMGEVVYSANYISSFTGISLENLSKGIYFLKINSANKKYVKKIVVSG